MPTIRGVGGTRAVALLIMGLTMFYHVLPHYSGPHGPKHLGHRATITLFITLSRTQLLAFIVLYSGSSRTGRMSEHISPADLKSRFDAFFVLLRLKGQALQCLCQVLHQKLRPRPTCSLAGDHQLPNSTATVRSIRRRSARCEGQELVQFYKCNEILQYYVTMP